MTRTWKRGLFLVLLVLAAVLVMGLTTSAMADGVLGDVTWGYSDTIEYGNQISNYSVKVSVSTASTSTDLDTEKTLSVVVTKDSTAPNAGGKYTLTVTAPNGYAFSNGEATATKVVTISPKTVTVVWTESTLSLEYNGNEQAPTATLSGVVGSDDVSVSVTGGKTDVGTGYSASAELTGNSKDNYEITGSAQTAFVITAKPVTITWDSTTSFVYNGSEQAPSATLSETVEGDDVDISVSGQKTNVGDNYSATVELTGNKKGNYSIPEASKSKSFKITPASLTITAKPQTYTYNGSAQGPAKTYTSGFDTYVTVTGLKGSDALTSITLTGSQTNAKTYTDEIVPSEAAIGNATDNYDISYEKGTLTINPKAVTITAGSSVAYYDGDPFTYDEFTATALETGDSHTFTVKMTSDSTITDVGTQANVIGSVDGTEISASAGEEGTLVGNYQVTTEDGMLEVIPLPVIVVPDADQSKKFGEKDPTLTYTLKLDEEALETIPVDQDEETGPAVPDVDPNNFADELEGDLSRDAGEKIGTYKILQGEVKCTTGNLAVSFDDSVEFEILPEFAGTVKLATSPVTSRTNKVDWTVSGITVKDFGGAAPTLKLVVTDKVKAKAADVEAAKDGDFTMAITGGSYTDDAKSKLGYFGYLPDGTYDLQIIMPKQDGTTKEEKVATLTVAKDSFKILKIFNTNTHNDAEDKISKPDGDTIQVEFDKTFVSKTRDWASGDKEIVKLEITVDGKSIYDADKYVNITELKTEISKDLLDYLAKNDNGQETSKVNIKVTVVTPDLSETTLSREFTYDYKALPLAGVSFEDLHNRTYSFTVNLPEIGKITAATIDGFTINVDSITYEGGDIAGYGTKAKVTAAFSTESLPSSKAKVSITYEDYSGNEYVYTQDAVGQAPTKGIQVYRIEPGKNAQNKKDVRVRETNVLRMSGMATGYESLNVMLSAKSGFRWATRTKVSGHNEWQPESDAFWELTIGDRKSELSLQEQLNLPKDEPITLAVSYDDVNGSGYRTILIYDDECQEPVILSPTYPGMRVLIGYTEPGSIVTVTWSNGSQEVEVNPWGFFVIVFDEGIYDPEITLDIEDLAGNEYSVDIPVPGRETDANTTVNVYPLGAMIQDEIGMVKFVATPVSMEELEKGDIELPILACNYFKVGTMTISRNAEGKITFTPVMDPAFAAENAGVYFNIYAEQPAADALDPENRGEGLNIADGYTPDENVKDFWFVYETQATLTGGQLTDPESADTVDINTSEQFVGFQGKAAD